MTVRERTIGEDSLAVVGGTMAKVKYAQTSVSCVGTLRVWCCSR